MPIAVEAQPAFVARAKAAAPPEPAPSSGCTTTRLRRATWMKRRPIHLPEPLALDPDAFSDDDLFAVPFDNPFAPQTQRERPLREGVPRKLALLDRGRGIFGSYGKVLLVDEQAVAYCQFGPLSAYPRARRLRELYASCLTRRAGGDHVHRLDRRGAYQGLRSRPGR